MMLGNGSYEFIVADRGGKSRIGVLDGVSTATITMRRDDTGTLRMKVSPETVSCRDLLGGIRTVRNEMVVYRDGVRVWEGPITRLGYYPDTVEIDASDITWYLSRRALQFGFDYTGVSENAVNAVYAVLVQHYPATGDPFNIGPYLTRVNSSNDARTAAKYSPYTMTVFEMLDKYAEDGGLDYVVRGRRLIVKDTHCRAHVLPKLTERSFRSDIGVVEYGSELVTRSITVNSEGLYRTAAAPSQYINYYGTIDRVVTSTSESGTNATVTGEALQSLADREMFSGYPSPVDILVPASSPLDPCVDVAYEDVIPGAWVPVEVLDTIRQVSQWQRIDEVRTEITKDGDSVLLSMGQAPAVWVEPTGVVSP